MAVAVWACLAAATPSLGEDFSSRLFWGDAASDIRSQSQAALEDRKRVIEGTLARLSKFSMTSGVGRIGYRSAAYSEAASEVFFEIELVSPVIVDEVVLVPAIWRDAKVGFVADAFPEAFRVTGRTPDGVELLLAEAVGGHDLLPRVAPVVLRFPSVAVRAVRLTALRLGRRYFDAVHCLQMAEVMVFSAGRNVALGQTVRASSSNIAGSGSYHHQFLTDGFVPYLMDTEPKEGSLAFTNAQDSAESMRLTIDLGASRALDTLVLHVVEQSDVVPQAFPGDYGVPFRFVLEGADEPTFQEPRELLRFFRSTVYETSPIMVLPLRAGSARFVRLKALEPYVFTGVSEGGLRLTGARLGFAEIQLLAGAENVALGRPVHASFDPGTETRRLNNLTDGKNLYGEIIPIRSWMLELARRHDLEREHPLIEAELAARNVQVREFLRLLELSLWPAVTLLAGAVLASRYLHRRAVEQERLRISADLHDELGANVSAIALLGELASQEKARPAEMERHLQRIRALAERTRDAVRYCADMLHTPGLYENLVEEMRRVAHRLTEDVEHTVEVSGEAFASQVAQRDRTDILLFYKECLINALRHSGASRLQTRLTIDARRLCLEVADNGRGLPAAMVRVVPPSLRRRASLLGGKASTAPEPGGGTRVSLVFRWRGRWPLSLQRLWPRHE